MVLRAPQNQMFLLFVLLRPDPVGLVCPPETSRDFRGTIILTVSDCFFSCGFNSVDFKTKSI